MSRRVIREKRGELSGPILKTGKRGGGWRDHWEAFLAAHWPDPWNPDQLRHSFGSYRMAQTKNAEEVSHEMGNSPAIVLEHYWNWKTQADFIKEVIERGDNVLIGTPIREGPSVLKHEIKQLVKAGYKTVEQGSKWLIKGTE